MKFESVNTTVLSLRSVSTVSAVVLTTGNRVRELNSALNSLIEASISNLDVVWNSSKPPVDFEHGVFAQPPSLLQPGGNLGIAGGRNFGIFRQQSEFVLCLDDDAVLLSTDIQDSAITHFRTNPRCAVIAMRIVDERHSTLRRHNPRFGTTGVHRSGAVGTFLGGACIIRLSAFVDVGGYNADFFYSMEEQDLTWRLYSAGWNVYYLPDLKVYHPHTSPNRHTSALEQTWTNRCKSARMSLPSLLIPPYLLLHGVRSLRMGLKLSNLFAGLKIFIERMPERQPLKWRHVWILSKAGRPPII